MDLVAGGPPISLLDRVCARAWATLVFFGEYEATVRDRSQSVADSVDLRHAMRVCGALSFCVLLTAGRAEAFALSTKLAILPRGTASPSLARPGLAPPASRAGRRSGGSPLRMAEVTFSGAVDTEARKTLEIALDTSVQSGVMYVKLVDESSPDPSSHTTALEASRVPACTSSAHVHTDQRATVLRILMERARG